MTTRHPLPDGQWAELMEPRELFGADQDAFLDKYDELIDKHPQPRPEPQPDPANPAVMLPVPPRQLNRTGNRLLQDWILAKVVKAWSFPLELPYRTEYRTLPDADGLPVIPLPSLNALTAAAKRVQNTLLDIDEDAEAAVAAGAPKSGPPSGTGGSEGTSPGSTPSPLPAPPAVQSGTP